MWSPVSALNGLTSHPSAPHTTHFLIQKLQRLFFSRQELFTGCQLGIIGAAIFKKKNEKYQFLLQRSSCSIFSYNSHFTAIGGGKKKIVVLKNKLQDFATRKQARKLAIFLFLKQSWTNPRKPGPQNTYRLQMEPLSASSVSNRWKPVIGWRFESYRNLSSPGYWAY